MCCPLCSSESIIQIYQDKNVPIFQNKVYNTRDEAYNIKCTNISLSFCENCGFVWNSSFDPTLLEYDENYQNEQGLSEKFQSHLNDVMNIIKKYINQKSNVIEIGCGKAKFLMMLDKEGFNISGYDPAYEGDDERIIKSYYPPKQESQKIQADIIILRHVLEHIKNPIEFLKMIASANNYSGLLYIEVPDFNWIINHKAFYDIFYEHCNYFSLLALQNIFKNSISSGLFFGGQYCYTIIKLDIFKSDIKIKNNLNYVAPILKTDEANYWKNMVKDETESIFIWGAGAKGATFLHNVDSDCKHILGAIDINPVKQNKFIAKTGHEIFSPDILNKIHPSKIIIMNGNYFSEISNMIKENYNVKCDMVAVDYD